MACVASKDGNIYDSSSDDMVRFVRFCVLRKCVLMCVRDVEMEWCTAARLLFLAHSF